MDKLSCAGVDVAAETIAAVKQHADQRRERREFENNAAGHRKLIAWLRRGAMTVRVVQESTGSYGLDLALALHDAQPRVDVMVLGSKEARRFAESLGRKDKDDEIDAETLLEYALRMEFRPWTPPSRERLQLRLVTRHIRQLQEARTIQKNQWHAAKATAASPRSVRDSAARLDAVFEREIAGQYREAQRLVEADPELAEGLRLLRTIKGVGLKSALLILGELGALAAGLGPRQWVAWAGLCPRRWNSGRSVHRKARLGHGNRYLKAALFMPALVASRTDPPVRAFRDRLCSRGLKPIQATAAVMRKLLHAIHGVLKTRTPYDATKTFPLIEPQAPRNATTKHARRRRPAPAA